MLAFGLTLLAVPLVRRIAVAYELYDRPDAGLKPHERPIPYLGGVAIWVGWLAVVVLGIADWGLGIAGWGSPNGQEGSYWPLAWVAVGGSVLMLVGLIDDIRHLPPKLRLLVQVAVAVLLLCSGVGRGVWSALLGPLHGSLPSWMFGDVIGTCLSGLFCVFVLAGAANSTNMIDGLDGLCAGVLGVASAGFWGITVLLWDIPAQSGMTAPALQVLLCAGVAGACVGFLCYNFNPASMFMGDSGALLLGYSAAVLIITLTEQASWRGLIASVFVFGFPIFDAGLAIARRWLNGKPLFIGDRSHFYDQLRDRGRSVRRTVLVCYLIGALCAMLGCACVFLPVLWVVGIAVASPVVACLACRRLGMLRVDDAAERSSVR